MTLKEHFKAGYELFGPEAMKIADKFFGGEIDWDTFMSLVEEPVVKYRIHMMMWDEIESTKPKLLKVTSWFADYINEQGIEFIDETGELPSNGVVGQFKSIPIEIDDGIGNEYYELIY